MRKILTIFLALALIWALPLGAFAAEGILTMEDVSASPGDTVLFSVKLAEGITADTLGITYTYDTALLERVPTACSWTPKGVLSDFNHKDTGVWTVSSPVKLEGEVCVIALRVKPGVTFTSTTVSCTLTARSAGSEVGSFTAQGELTQYCDHSYGSWKNLGISGHQKSCAKCDKKLTESHSWDQGSLASDGTSTYTCTVCGGTQTTTATGGPSGSLIPTQPSQQRPEVPTATEATWGRWDPEEETYAQPKETIPPNAPTQTVIEVPRPTEAPRQNQSSSQQGSSGQQNQSGSQPAGGQTSVQSGQQVIATYPITDYNQVKEDGSLANVQVNPNATQPSSAQTHSTDDGHDHSHEEEGPTLVKLLLLIGLLTVLTGAAMYIVKKKR